MVSRGGWVFPLVCCLLVTLGTAGPLFGQSMRVISTTVPLPAEDAEVSLPGLAYGYPWKTQFTSIRWAVDKEESDRIRILWTVSGSNSRAKPQRARFKLDLLDDSGEAVGTYVKSMIFRPSTKDQKFKIKMKVPLDQWTRVEALRITVNFIIGA